MSNKKVIIDMPYWVEMIKLQKTFNPKTIIEIGSLHGKDADILGKEYKTNNVYIFEAHPHFFSNIKRNYPNYHVFNLAASNINGKTLFNCVEDDATRRGISSLLDRNGVNYIKKEIETKRLDTFVNEHKITEIDLLKIDVEGFSYEVLEGFGNKLNIVKSIHVECEHIPVWVNQKTYPHVEEILIKNNFILLDIRAAWPQTDSIWVRKDLFNPKWWY